MKKEDLARNVRLEDGDFLYDLGSYAHPDLQKKGRFWRQFQEFVRSLHDMTWPEACLKILRRFHVEVTPIELIDSFKNFLQAPTMSDEDYILLMHSRAMGLSSVLPMKDALLFTVANLNDSRVKLPLEEAINQGKISTFNALFQGTVEFNRRYVGSQNKNKTPSTRHTTHHVQDGEGMIFQH